MMLPQETADTLATIPAQVDQVLGVLAERFGTTAGHLWQVLVRQQVVEAWGAALWMLAAVFLLIAAVLSVRYGTRLYDKDPYDDALAPVMVFAVMAGLFASILLGANLQPVLTGFLNPEYGALKEILEALP